MVKESKFFRKQAEKAERMARAISDVEAAESLSNLCQSLSPSGRRAKAQAETIQEAALSWAWPEA
jgi:hypothetical protein